MGYFRYDAKSKRFYIIAGKRPTNQSEPKVIKKIASRLEKMQLENPNITFTSLQNNFVKMVKNNRVKLKDSGIDIAHNIAIAIAVLMDAMVDRMNNPKKERDKVAEDFIEEAISSDSPTSKQRMRDGFEYLRDPKISPEVKIAKANEMVNRLNKASKNLMPGYASTNRSVGKARDPHLVQYQGRYVETLNSNRLSCAANEFLGYSYTPKSLRVSVVSPEMQFQSSSIDASPQKSWLSLIMRPEEILPQKPLPPKNNAKNFSGFWSSFKCFSPSQTAFDNRLLPEEKLKVQPKFVGKKV